MRFTISASAVLAMAASVFAQTPDFDPVNKPTPNEKIAAGSTYVVEWEAPAKYAEGTVSLHLIGGATQDTQVPLLDIAAGIPNSALKYSWTVDGTLGDAAVYGLIIKLESSPEVYQYSNPFHITPSKAGYETTTSAAGTTITTSTGAVTVTLSSCTTSETPVVTTSSKVFSTTSVAQNTTTFATSTTVKPPPTVITTTSVVEPPASTEVTPPPAASTTPPASGAAGLSAPVALIGALALALFAL